MWGTCIDFLRGEPHVMNQYPITVIPDYRVLHLFPKTLAQHLIQSLQPWCLSSTWDIGGKHLAYEVM